MATATQTANLHGILGGLAFGFRDSNGFPSSVSNSLITGITKVSKENIVAASGTYTGMVTVADWTTVDKVLLVNKSATITGRVATVDTSAKAAYLELGPGSAYFLDSTNIETKEDGSGFSAFTAINTVTVAGVSGTADIICVVVGT